MSKASEFKESMEAMGRLASVLGLDDPIQLISYLAWVARDGNYVLEDREAGISLHLPPIPEGIKNVRKPEQKRSGIVVSTS